MDIDAVIPTLEEAERIAETVRWTAGLGFRRVIVCDGGSGDATVERAREAGATVVTGPVGRATQCNRGAAESDADAMVFVHADAMLPEDACGAIRGALADPGVVGGAFRIRTVARAGRRRLWLRLADVRSHWTRLPYGDQAIFARRSTFDAVGGFPELPIFEDLAFSEAMRRVGTLARLRSEVRVSGRRLEARPVYYATLMTVLPTLYRLGVSPERLTRLYPPER